MLRRWKSADLQTAFTCLAIDRNSSNQTSMFFAAGDACIRSRRIYLWLQQRKMKRVLNKVHFLNGKLMLSEG